VCVCYCHIMHLVPELRHAIDELFTLLRVSHSVSALDITTTCIILLLPATTLDITWNHVWLLFAYALLSLSLLTYCAESAVKLQSILATDYTVFSFLWLMLTSCRHQNVRPFHRSRKSADGNRRATAACGGLRSVGRLTDTLDNSIVASSSSSSCRRPPETRLEGSLLAKPLASAPVVAESWWLDVKSWRALSFSRSMLSRADSREQFRARPIFTVI